jgi:hypothetical protein
MSEFVEELPDIAPFYHQIGTSSARKTVPKNLPLMKKVHEKIKI